MTVRNPPYGEKFEILLNVVLIAKIKRFGTLNATQKTAALYKAPFLKNQGKLPEAGRFNKKKGMFTIFRKFFLIFSRTVFCRGLRFFALSSVFLMVKKLHSVGKMVDFFFFN